MRKIMLTVIIGITGLAVLAGTLPPRQCIIGFDRITDDKVEKRVIEFQNYEDLIDGIYDVVYALGQRDGKLGKSEEKFKGVFREIMMRGGYQLAMKYHDGYISKVKQKPVTTGAELIREVENLSAPRTHNFLVEELELAETD